MACFTIVITRGPGTFCPKMDPFQLCFYFTMSSIISPDTQNILSDLWAKCINGFREISCQLMEGFLILILPSASADASADKSAAKY